jgi:regulator of protease activity HflC (stomatin/prohibitin superfamily)
MDRIRGLLQLDRHQVPAAGEGGAMTVSKLKIFLLGVLLLIVLSTVLGCFYTIDSGRIGVIQTFGRYQEAVSAPGLHWKRPFIDTVINMDVKLQSANYAGNQDEEDSDGIIYKPHLDVLDAKNVSYDIEMSVMFTPVAEKMPEILTTYGANYFDKKINPIIRDVVRDVGGKYNVETIADHRDAINSEIRTRLVEQFKPLPFIFSDAALRKIQLPPNIMQKIVAVQEAKQEEERLKIINRQAEQNKQITITNAQAEKEKQIIAAQAEAESVLTRAKAQAEANQRISQSLTPLLVQQNQIERWTGEVPQVVGGENTNLLYNLASPAR